MDNPFDLQPSNLAQGEWAPFNSLPEILEEHCWNNILDVPYFNEQVDVEAQTFFNWNAESKSTFIETNVEPGSFALGGQPVIDAGYLQASSDCLLRASADGKPNPYLIDIFTTDHQQPVILMDNFGTAPRQIESLGSTRSDLATPEDYSGVNSIQFHVGAFQTSSASGVCDATENLELTNIISTKHLASLPPSLLEEIAGNVAKALIIIEQKKDAESLESMGTKSPPEQDIAEPKRGKAESRSHKALFMCEHIGCMTTFQRKKDRSRHFRQKHQANEGFGCPLVDCSMGTGHKIQRRDKLRDHLRRKAQSSSLWQCILPECFETAIGKTGMIDHLGHHDRPTRLVHQQLLIDYGFISGDIHPGSYYDKPPLGYLTCEYICVVQGCQFGTNSIEVMNNHRSIPHEGSHCPCPMPDCQEFFQDWSSTSAHLARNHDAVARKTFETVLLDQGFWWRSSVFTCPICLYEIKILLNKVSCDEKVRRHCRTHDNQQIMAASKDLVQAFASSNRRTLWYPRMPLLDPANDDQVFAYLTWPKADLPKIWNMTGLAPELELS